MPQYHTTYSVNRIIVKKLWIYPVHRQHILEEQDKSSDIEQQPPYGDHK